MDQLRDSGWGRRLRRGHLLPTLTEETVKLSVGIEFLLSGALLMLGLASLAEALDPGLVLGPLRDLLFDQKTRISDNVAIAAATAFLGICYAIGVLVNVSIYDLFFYSRMQKIVTQLLSRNQDVMDQLRSLPHFSISEGDVYGVISSYLDTCAPASVQRRRTFERSLQRLARGSLPGLVVLLITGLLRIDGRYMLANYRGDPGYVTTSILALSVLVLLVLSALYQVKSSMKDEALYFVRVFAILQRRPRDAASGP